jgi:hypothetical protein
VDLLRRHAATILRSAEALPSQIARQSNSSQFGAAFDELRQCLEGLEQLTKLSAKVHRVLRAPSRAGGASAAHSDLGELQARAVLAAGNAARAFVAGLRQRLRRAGSDAETRHIFELATAFLPLQASFSVVAGARPPWALAAHDVIELVATARGWRLAAQLDSRAALGGDDTAGSAADVLRLEESREAHFFAPYAQDMSPFVFAAGDFRAVAMRPWLLDGAVLARACFAAVGSSAQAGEIQRYFGRRVVSAALGVIALAAPRRSALASPANGAYDVDVGRLLLRVRNAAQGPGATGADISAGVTPLFDALRGTVNCCRRLEAVCALSLASALAWASATIVADWGTRQMARLAADGDWSLHRMCSLALEIQLIGQYMHHTARQRACRCYGLQTPETALLLQGAALSEHIAEGAEDLAREVCSQHLPARTAELSLAVAAATGAAAGPSLLASGIASKVLAPLKSSCAPVGQFPHLRAVASNTLAPAINAALHVITDQILARRLIITSNARQQLQADFVFLRAWVEREFGALCDAASLFGQLPVFHRQDLVLAALDSRVAAVPSVLLLPDAAQWRSLLN